MTKAGFIVDLRWLSGLLAKLVEKSRWASWVVVDIFMVIGTAFSRSRQKDDLCHILSLRSMQVLTGKKPIVLIVFSPFRRRTRMPAQPGTGGYGKLWQHRRQCPDSSSTKHNQIKSAEPYLEIYLEYPCVSSNSRRCYSIPLALVSEYRSQLSYNSIQQPSTAHVHNKTSTLTSSVHAQSAWYLCIFTSEYESCWTIISRYI